MKVKKSYPNVCAGKKLFFHHWSESAFERLVKEIFTDKQYGYPFLDIPLDTVVDLGANSGMFSMWIYDRAKTIHAIEPFTKNYKQLALNIYSNSLEDKVKLYRTAISEIEGEVKMFQTEDPIGTKISHGLEDNELECVPSTTLPKFLSDNKINNVDLLKVDIEGSESQIFTKEVVKELSPIIKNYIGEHADPAMEKAFSEAGYEFGRVEEKRIWYAKS